MSKQLWAIADIHGQRDHLIDLMKNIGYQAKTHQLIFLGDYVDRGPHSRQVLNILKHLQEEGAICLRGNHETLMIDGVCYGKQQGFLWRFSGEDPFTLWCYNGGQKTVESYPEEEDWEALIDKDVSWLKSLPLWHEEPGFFFSHAPVPARLAHWELAKASLDVLTWSYGEPEESFAKRLDGRIGVCGHVHALINGNFNPRFYPHYYYVDSGCGCHPRAYLSAVRLDLEEKSRHYVTSIHGEQRFQLHENAKPIRFRPERW